VKARLPLLALHISTLYPLHHGDTTYLIEPHQAAIREIKSLVGDGTLQDTWFSMMKREYGRMGRLVGIYLFWAEHGKVMRCLSRTVEGFTNFPYTSADTLANLTTHACKRNPTI